MLLLFILAALIPDRLEVISIDHQLQENSRYWSALVLKTCEDLNIPCHIQAVNVHAGNLEAQARIARYQAFEQVLKPKDVLILGHHQQDLAETVILRLLQGTGVDGLAAMQMLEVRHFSSQYDQGTHHHKLNHSEANSEFYYLWRPLLTLSKDHIQTWVEQCKIDYCEDPMNHDTDFDRVWCRQTLWTVLEQRFPQMQNSIARCATLMQDAQDILKETLTRDWQACVDAQGRIQLIIFKNLSQARQRQLLSTWMQGEAQYRPPLAMVERLQNEVIDAAEDATSVLHHADVFFMRFDAHLYRYGQQEWHAIQQPVREYNICFQLDHEYGMPSGDFRISRCTSSAGFGLSDDLLTQDLTLCPRIGGEKVRLLGRQGTKVLKKELHAAKIAPWYRHQIQILMYHNEILGIFTPKGFWLAESSFCVAQSGWLPVRHR